MKKEQKEFFDLLDEFRKLNISSMLPCVPHGEACILKSIREVGMKKGQNKPVRVADIIEEMRVPAPSVSRGLRALEERGLLTRRVDEKDRRNTFVALTAKGEKLSQEIEDIMTDYADSVFERVGTESFAKLNEHMRIFIDASIEEMKRRKYTEKK